MSLAPSRRTLVKGAAWSMPVIAIGASTAGAAASCTPGTVQYPGPGEYTVYPRSNVPDTDSFDAMSAFTLIGGDPSQVQYVATGNHNYTSYEATEFNIGQIVVPACTTMTIVWSVSIRRNDAVGSNPTTATILLRDPAGTFVVNEKWSSQLGRGTYLEPNVTLGEWGPEAVYTYSYSNSGTSDVTFPLLQQGFTAKDKPTSASPAINDDLRIIARITSSAA